MKFVIVFGIKRLYFVVKEELKIKWYFYFRVFGYFFFICLHWREYQRIISTHYSFSCCHCVKIDCSKNYFSGFRKIEKQKEKKKTLFTKCVLFLIFFFIFRLVSIFSENRQHRHIIDSCNWKRLFIFLFCTLFHFIFFFIHLSHLS